MVGANCISARVGDSMGNKIPVAGSFKNTSRRTTTLYSMEDRNEKLLRKSSHSKTERDEKHLAKHMPPWSAPVRVQARVVPASEEDSVEIKNPLAAEKRSKQTRKNTV